MIEFFGADGWPVERFIGRPVTNLIRLVLHTRGLRIEVGTAHAWRPGAPYVVEAPSAGTQRTVAGGPQGTQEGTAVSAFEDSLGERKPAPNPQTLIARKEATCATIDVDGILHTCELTPGHDGDHVCRAGDWEWK